MKTLRPARRPRPFRKGGFATAYLHYLFRLRRTAQNRHRSALLGTDFTTASTTGVWGMWQ